DPFYDSPDVIQAEPEPPSRPSVGQRVRRFFDFLLRLVATLIILGVIGLGLYYGLPLLYQKYIVPVEQNMAEVTELQSWQKQTDQDLADLQSRLEAMETEQGQNAEALTELDERTSGIETEIAAHTKSLAALERMQTELEEQNEATSAELQRQINMLKAMELLSRARLFMYQSNFGLARQDVKIARDLIATVQKDAPDSLAEDLEEVVRRLDLVLTDLPNFPGAASDDLNVAWQILLLGLPEAGSGTSVDGTPMPTLAPTLTPVATFTPTSQVTVEPTATQ
ncbi:MAG TPA: hypothetical protein VK880_09860, partial [Anaerolineales bacterium]|nr:hypothetical protein [Anaerolineales bacterium]